MIFARIIPDSDEPEDVIARAFIEEAGKEPHTCNMTLQEMIEQSYEQKCFIYLAIMEKPVGVMVLKPFPEEGTLNAVLLGGDKMLEHKNEVMAHAVKMMKKLQANSLIVIGRKGWAKVYPELEFQGIIYSLPCPTDNN